jgi:hypothetical protein
MTAMSTVAASTANADSATPAATPYPMAHAVPGLSTGGQMVWAKGHLFVSSGPNGSTIKVLSSAGQVEKTLTGESGADGMVASADGSTVYVALDTATGEIGEIDTTSLTQTTTHPVNSCPAEVALSSGRLFYSYGCDSSLTAGVSSIDPASGGSPVPVESGDSGAPLISGATSVLAVANGSTLRTYSTADDGGTTALASNISTLEERPNEIALTPDGQTLLTASGAPYEIDTFDTASLTAGSPYPGVAYPEAVAVDPSGTHVAGGFNADDSTVRLYAATSHSVDWSRYTTGTDPARWRETEDIEEVEPGTLTFSSDGSRVYGLVMHGDSNGLFLFASSLSPTATRISVMAPNVKPGKPLTARSVVSGVSHGAVSFAVTAVNSTTRSVGSATSTSSGIATKSFHSSSNGTIRATFLGSATQLPSTATSRFTVGSVTRSRLVGYYKKHRGIAYFRSYKKVNVVFRTTPAEQQRAGIAWIEQKRGRHWYVLNHITGFENQYGAKVVFKGNQGALELRVKFKAKSDAFSRGSTAISKPFVVLSDRIRL